MNYFLIKIIKIINPENFKTILGDLNPIFRGFNFWDPKDL